MVLTKEEREIKLKILKLGSEIEAGEERIRKLDTRIPQKKKKKKKVSKKFLKQRVISRRVLRKPEQLKIVIRKKEAETPRAIFFKQELIGAQNVLFGK